MAILTTGDVATYAPTVTATGSELNALLALAESIAQGPSGSHCSIEKSIRNEQRTVGYSLQTVQLSYWPIDLSAEIVLQGRYGNVRNRFRRSVGISQWITIDDGAYVLDETGHLSLNNGNSIFDFNRSTNGSELTEIKIQYTAGVDFTADNDEVKSLKYALGGILTALSDSSQDPFSGRSLQSWDSHLEGKVTFASTSQSRSGSMTISPVAGVADYLLDPFRKYRPRGLY